MKQLKNLDEQLVRQLSEQRDEKHRFGYYYAVGRSESVLQKIKEQAFGLAPFFVCMQRENEAQTCAAALAPFAALCLNRDIAFHKQARKAQGENDMKNILVVVDMQKDFVDGALGSPAAQAIVPAVCAAIADVRYDGIFVTLDTHGEHYAETLEGRLLPVPHCIRGTAGWALDAAVAAELSTKKWESVEKPTFGSACRRNGRRGGCVRDLLRPVHRYLRCIECFAAARRLPEPAAPRAGRCLRGHERSRPRGRACHHAQLPDRGLRIKRIKEYLYGNFKAKITQKSTKIGVDRTSFLIHNPYTSDTGL